MIAPEFVETNFPSAKLKTSVVVAVANDSRACSEISPDVVVTLPTTVTQPTARMSIAPVAEAPSDNAASPTVNVSNSSTNRPPPVMLAINTSLRISSRLLAVPNEPLPDEKWKRGA